MPVETDRRAATRREYLDQLAAQIRADDVLFVILNGIHTDGDGNIDRGRDALMRLDLYVYDVKIPKRSSFTAKWTTKRDGEGAIVQADILDHIGNGGKVVLLAHSRGGLVAGYIHNKALSDLTVLANPAMKRSYQWYHPWTVYNYHSPDDHVVSWLAAVAGYVWNDFGRAGALGFTDQRVNNIMITHGHNGVWDVYLGQWLELVLEETVKVIQR